MAAAAAAPARPPSAEALFDLAAAGDAAGIREALGNGANAMTENKVSFLRACQPPAGRGRP